MASVQEVTVAELVEVEGGILPLLGAIAVGVGFCILAGYAKQNEPKGSALGVTNFQLLGITPPKPL
jgi:lactobin A/cerein 7B family class IIb bacteriocin